MLSMPLKPSFAAVPTNGEGAYALQVLQLSKAAAVLDTNLARSLKRHDALH